MHAAITDRFVIRAGTLILIPLIVRTIWAEQPSAERQRSSAATAAEEGLPRLPAPTGARRLAADVDAWIDPVRKAVIMDGAVCLREGPLEMFACTRGTKEHESIVSIGIQAYMVHAALLSLGAEAGAPAQFTPTYIPARGTQVDIALRWIGGDGKQHEAKAQDWVRDAKTNKAMVHAWVFAGSGFWTDPRTGKKYYQAEGGDFICVSNFPSAMLDLPIESTQANDGLLFEAFAGRIPPLGTPVRLILLPKVAKEGARQQSR